MLAVIFSVAIAVIAVDQAVKLWAAYVLQPVSDIPLWEGVFHLTYARNEGAAFGMMDGARWMFIVLTLLVVAAGIGWMIWRRKKLNLYVGITCGLLLGGAIGNLIDRIAQGYVTDLFYFKLINFAIFNVADAAMVIGVLLLAVYLLFIYKEPKKSESLPEETHDTAADT